MSKRAKLSFFMLFYMLLLFLGKAIIFFDYSIDIKQDLVILINFFITVYALLIIIKSKEPLSKYGVYFNFIFDEIGWGIIAGIIYNLFTQGRIISRSISADRIISVLLVALSEELIWRGYILSMVSDILNNPKYSILLVALGFALMHVIVNFNLTQVVAAFFLGIFWNFLRLQKNVSIFFPIFMHFVINIV